MLLFVGLGNPGAKYARHRHNVGFMAVDAIHRAHGFGPWRRKFSAEISEGRLAGRKVMLMKPMTFMNESGRAVGEAVRWLKLSPEEVWVFHDELDLAPGKVRVKKGGGHAGHNGLRSIGQHIGPDFNRVRIGIGHPGAKEKVTGYVLHDFSRAEEDWLFPLLEVIGREAERLASGDAAGFMNAVALATRGMPGPARAREPSDAPSVAEPHDNNEEKGGRGPFAALLAKFGRR